MKSSEIKNFLEAVQGKRVAVVGDIILDEYVWGNVNRISPEAPVPVVEVKREEQKVGGAGNVAISLRAVGCNVSLYGLVGVDISGQRIRALLKEARIDDQLIGAGDERPTSTKTRVIASRQQVVRIDRESRGEIAHGDFNEILSRVKLAKPDVIVISDYGKGLLSKDLCREIIRFHSNSGAKIIVDPKGRDYEKYRGALLITPNQEETALVTGENVTDLNVKAAATYLHEKFGIKNILVTRSERGMFLLKEDGSSASVESKAREVFDVTGAGDTVVAFISAGLAAGLDLELAVQLANLAAGISVGHIGVYAVHPQDLLQPMTQ